MGRRMRVLEALICFMIISSNYAFIPGTDGEFEDMTWKLNVQTYKEETKSYFLLRYGYKFCYYSSLPYNVLFKLEAMYF